MITKPVIKVFYDGRGTARESKHWINDIDSRFVRRACQEFYLSDTDSKRFVQIGHVKINRFIFLSNKWGNDETHGDSFMFVPTDKDGNHDPFTLTADKLIDVHENGNALKLIFDDEQPAPPDTEKPLTENEREKLLSVIGAMLCVLKEQNVTNGQINEWIALKKVYGLGKSTLNEIFKEANKVFAEFSKTKED